MAVEVDVSGVSNSGSLLATELLYSSESIELSLQTWLKMGYQLGCDSLSANSNYFFLIIKHNFIPRSSPSRSIGSLSLFTEFAYLCLYVTKNYIVCYIKNPISHLNIVCVGS